MQALTLLYKEEEDQRSNHLDKNRGCFHTATDSTTTAHNSARQYALPTEDTMMAAEEKTSNIQKY